jgi:hypothetical protein
MNELLEKFENSFYVVVSYLYGDPTSNTFVFGVFSTLEKAKESAAELQNSNWTKEILVEGMNILNKPFV